jgi:hypothetical protein
MEGVKQSGFQPQAQGPKEKALQINLHAEVYGTFAEIGAGQEVARQFFQAGGASGTVAKSISAYDMIFSDSIYGKETSGRYVCRPRLMKMLDREFSQLIERLSPHRGQRTTFFAFANTVATINFKGDNEAHGWMGIRFQHTLGLAANQYSEIIIHARMLDTQSVLQQEALGIIGVNMIYAAFFIKGAHNIRQNFTKILMEDLGSDRIEINSLEVRGPAFCEEGKGEGGKLIDGRVLSLQLLKSNAASSIIFDPKGEILQPSEFLYKKNILALRGSFRPPTLVNLNMIQTGLENFKKEKGVDPDNIVILCEMTIKNLRTGGELDEADFLGRIELLGSLGLNVIISNYHEYYKLSSYYALFTKKLMGMVVGVYNLEEIFNSSQYQQLPGGILEALGRIFSRSVKMYIYPSLVDGADPNNFGVKDLLTCKNFKIEKEQVHLFEYFYDNGFIKDILDFDPAVFSIYSRTVLNMIQKGESGWEKMVPEIVALKVKKDKLFT